MESVNCGQAVPEDNSNSFSNLLKSVSTVVFPLSEMEPSSQASIIKHELVLAAGLPACHNYLRLSGESTEIIGVSMLPKEVRKNKILTIRDNQIESIISKITIFAKAVPEFALFFETMGD